MGRGTIVSGGSNGLYTLQRSRATQDGPQQIASLQVRRTALSGEVNALLVKQADLALEVEEARMALEAALTDWQQRLAAGEDGDPPIDPSDEDQKDAVKNWESDLLAAHNLRRVQHGLGTLHLTSELSASAQSHATWLANNDQVGHTGAGESSPRERILAAGYPTGPGAATGENMGYGQTSVSAVMDGWMNSPGHRANILDGDFEDVGFGYAYRAGTTYRHFWVVNFGRMPD